MEDDKKPHPIVRVISAILLLAFFGGGLALFINLFVPLLNEAAQAIISLGVMAMLLVGVVVGKCIHVIGALRGATKSNSSLDVEPADQNDVGLPFCHRDSRRL